MLNSAEVTQKDFYNDLAGAYARHLQSRHGLAYRYGLYDRIFAYMDLRGCRVLDAMCCVGESTEYFLRRGAVVIGLDIAHHCCRMTRSAWKAR